ncbi:hypothetical protein EBZ39_10360 [bacterium]|nr:hypothetical protein [bacterium]
MKKILVLLALISCVGVALDAHCRNVDHATKRGKRGTRYICNVKTRQFYQQSKGQAGADRMYDKNAACRTCGCSSVMHDRN